MAATNKERVMIETSRTVSSAVRSRQRVLAVFLPLTALLYIATEATNPKGVDQVITTSAIAAKVLPIAQQHTTQLYIAGTLSLFALAALAVSFAAIATMVRERGSTLATVAALLGGVGYLCGIVANVFVGINLAMVASAHIPQEAAAQVLITTFRSGVDQALFAVYAGAEYIAPILMCIALWRSRCVPRWLALLFVVGTEIAQQVPSAGPVKVVLLMAPFGVALVLLAIRIWQGAGGPVVTALEPVSVA